MLQLERSLQRINVQHEKGDTPHQMVVGQNLIRLVVPKVFFLGTYIVPSISWWSFSGFAEVAVVVSHFGLIIYIVYSIYICIYIHTYTHTHVNVRDVNEPCNRNM